MSKWQAGAYRPHSGLTLLSRRVLVPLGDWIERHVAWHCKIGVHSLPTFRTPADGGSWIWLCSNCKKEYGACPETYPVQREVPIYERITSWDAPE